MTWNRDIMQVPHICRSWQMWEAAPCTQCVAQLASQPHL
jgi:hypothetical protein